ncbi:signal peptidase I [Nocardioides fonticola]|uniref:signal peptidase I n=1 Tax=Nocardioides fonticola TaxID=450363 RepID=UPI0031CF7838
MGESTEVAAARPARRRRRVPVWAESLLLLVLAVTLALIVKTFLVQAFFIPSGSMEPGLVKNDRILVQKVSYWGSGTPQRGDVVVFDDPGDWLTPAEDTAPSNLLSKALSRIGLLPSGGHLVKRVIGVAGDTITCCDAQGRIKVDGVPLDSSDFIKDSGACQAPMIGCSWKAGPVPPGHVFVLGDHRDDSADSSYHLCRGSTPGCDPDDAYVPVSLITGKVFALVWPADRFRWERRPSVFADLDAAIKAREEDTTP